MQSSYVPEGHVPEMVETRCLVFQGPGNPRKYEH